MKISAYCTERKLSTKLTQKVYRYFKHYYRKKTALEEVQLRMTQRNTNEA